MPSRKMTTGNSESVDVEMVDGAGNDAELAERLAAGTESIIDRIAADSMRRSDISEAFILRNFGYSPTPVPDQAPEPENNLW